MMGSTVSDYNDSIDIRNSQLKPKMNRYYEIDELDRCVEAALPKTGYESRGGDSLLQ